MRVRAQEIQFRCSGEVNMVRAAASLVMLGMMVSASTTLAAVHTGITTPLYTEPTHFTCVPAAAKMELAQIGHGGETIYYSTTRQPTNGSLP